MFYLITYIEKTDCVTKTANCVTKYEPAMWLIKERGGMAGSLYGKPRDVILLHSIEINKDCFDLYDRKLHGAYLIC